MGGHYERDLFRQLEEQIAANKEQREEAHRREMHLKNESRQENARLTAVIHEQSMVITGLMQTIEKNNALIEQLLAEIQRLKSMLDNDSHNSSQPPSSDQKPRKANEYNHRSKSERKKGGQTGHSGKTLTKEDAEELIQSGTCRHEIVAHGEEKHGKRYTVKYEVDLRVETVVIEHRFYEDEEGKVTIPPEYHGDVRYGKVLGAIAAQLYSVGVVAIERIREFICDLSGAKVCISTGWVYKSIKHLAEQLKTSVIEKIQRDLQNKNVLCTDATCITVNGRQAYIRNISAGSSVLYMHMEKKTLTKLKELPILSGYVGTLMHDHETSLYHFGTSHAECNVHIMRYLKKNKEDTGHTWSEDMRQFLSDANMDRRKRIAAQEPYTQEELDLFEERYGQILAKGQEENQTCKPKWAKKDERSLLNRMEKYRKNHLLFLYNFDVPFDNNLSERDLRKCKNRQKMSGGFRLSEGADMFACILSAVETWKRRHMNVFSCFLKTLQGECPF